MSHENPPHAVDRRAMHNEPVLVNPGHSSDNPPVGMRGTIRVSLDNEVTIQLQFAVMFDRPSATQTIHLSPDQVAALLESKAARGEYVLTLDHLIEPPPPTLPDVVPNLL